MRRIAFGLIVLLIGFSAHAEDPLTVYQNLDEATARIARLGDKPFEKLIDPVTWMQQSEALIFHDVETGKEIWSMTQEACDEMANIERRRVWSADGSVMSLKGTRSYRDAQGVLTHTTWSGHNWLMNADLTHRRKLWVNDGGTLSKLTNKFDTWDRNTPRTLYYTGDDHNPDNGLYKVTVGDTAAGNTVEKIFEFSNPKRKIIQTINEDGIMCIQDFYQSSPEDDAHFYIVDLKKDPGDPNFVRTHTLDYGGMTGIDGHDPNNEYRVHQIQVVRGTDRVR